MNEDLWDKVRGLGSETWKGCEWVEVLVVLTATNKRQQEQHVQNSRLTLKKKDAT